MTATRRVPRGKWTDPAYDMVRIIGRRVEAILEHRGMSVSELAERIGDNQQTIDLIKRGVTKKCRRFRLENIARELDVPPEWLMGELKMLPDTTWHPIKDADGNWVLNAEGRGIFEEDYDVPPLRQIAQSAFAQLCRTALVNHRPAAERDTLQSVLSSILVDPLIWRGKLLNYPAGGRLTAEDQDDEAVVALSQAFSIILQPWFRGEVSLNADHLGNVLPVQHQLPKRLRKEERKRSRKNAHR